MIFDYILKLCLALALIFGLNFTTKNLRDKYGLEFSHFSFLKRKYAVKFNIKYKNLYFEHVIWDFTNRKLSTKFFSIQYRRFNSLLKLQNIVMNLLLPYCKLELRLKDMRNGSLSIEGINQLAGNIDLSYKLIGKKATFKKTSGRLEIVPIKYTLSELDDFDMDIGQGNLKLDLKKLSLDISMNSGLLNADMFLHTPVFQGHVKCLMGQENIIDLDLKYIDLIHCITEISDLLSKAPQFKVTKPEKPNLFNIKLNIRKCLFMNQKALKNINGSIDIAQNSIKAVDLKAYTDSNAVVSLHNENHGLIFLDCPKAGEVVDLIVPNIIKNGLLRGTLNFQTKKWDFNIMHAQVMPLGQIQIKHFASPLRWIRLMLVDPKEIDEIRGYGHFSNDMSRVIVGSIFGKNSYYGCSMNGFVDMEKDMISLSGHVSSMDLIGSKDTNIGKNSIKFWVSGKASTPELKFEMAPLNILTTLMQPILY